MAEDTDSYPQRAFELAPGATEVILLRHGASAHVVPGQPFPLSDGWGDPELAPEGAQQAEAAAVRLAGEPIGGVFISGLRRTVQTAAPLAARLGMEPSVVPDLREVHVGDWEGGEFRVRAAQGDPIVDRVFAEERWDVVPNAESMEHFADRVRRGITTVVAASAPETSVVAIVHAGVVAEACRQATTSRPFAFVHVDNCSLTRLVVLADGAWLLRSFNDVAHLDGRRTSEPSVPA